MGSESNVCVMGPPESCNNFDTSMGQYSIEGCSHFQSGSRRELEEECEDYGDENTTFKLLMEQNPDVFGYYTCTEIAKRENCGRQVFDEDGNSVVKVKTYCVKSCNQCPTDPPRTLPPGTDGVQTRGSVFVTGNTNIKSGEKTKIGYFNMGVDLGGAADTVSIPLSPFTADNGLIYSSTLNGKGLFGGSPAFQGQVTNGYGETFESPFIEATTPPPTSAPVSSKCVNDPNFVRGGKKKMGKDKNKKKRKCEKKNKEGKCEKKEEKGKDCDEFTKKNKDKKCRLKDVKDSCPAICKEELCMCMDRKEPIKYRKEFLTCMEIKDRGLCKKKKLADVCPISCDVECLI